MSDDGMGISIDVKGGKTMLGKLDKLKWIAPAILLAVTSGARAQSLPVTLKAPRQLQPAGEVELVPGESKIPGEFQKMPDSAKPKEFEGPTPKQLDGSPAGQRVFERIFEPSGCGDGEVPCYGGPSN